MCERERGRERGRESDRGREREGERETSDGEGPPGAEDEPDGHLTNAQQEAQVEARVHNEPQLRTPHLLDARAVKSLVKSLVKHAPARVHNEAQL